MGRRYSLALMGMGVRQTGWDIADGKPLDLTGEKAAIVAVPTPQHSDAIDTLLDRGIKSILCEKPLADNIPDAIATVENCKTAGCALHVVNNWRWFKGASKLLTPGNHKIYYRGLTFGREALWMNVCQAVHYAKKFRPDLNYSDLWVMSIDNIPVHYEEVQLSYRHMLFDWINGAKNCMGGAESVDMMGEAMRWERQSELL